MKIFFDTEFTGLHQNTTLISIGLITEDGQTFYAELTDYDSDQIDDWLQENVISHLRLHQNPENMATAWALGNGSVEVKAASNAIANLLARWLEQFDIAEMWSDTLAYDWVLFCQLYGHALNIPKNIYYIPFDIATLMKINNIDPDINREEFAEMGGKIAKHNALWDARIIKACYERLVTKEI